jgi:hypothetical protein
MVRVDAVAAAQALLWAGRALLYWAIVFGVAGALLARAAVLALLHAATALVPTRAPQLRPLVSASLVARVQPKIRQSAGASIRSTPPPQHVLTRAPEGRGLTPTRSELEPLLPGGSDSDTATLHDAAAKAPSLQEWVEHGDEVGEPRTPTTAEPGPRQTERPAARANTGFSRELAAAAADIMDSY